MIDIWKVVNKILSFCYLILKIVRVWKNIIQWEDEREIIYNLNN